MEILIEKLDNRGNGISHINGKIIFVPKCLEGELVDVDIIKETKKYYIGKLNHIIISSPNRVSAICKYFNDCGGCDLLNLSYDDALKYKCFKIKEIFKKYLNYKLDLNIIVSDDLCNYRNKLTLHIDNGNFGLINEQKEIINIDKCEIVNESINECISFIKKLNLYRAKILIRSNYLNELLISIETNENVKVSNVPANIKGIIVNDNLIYGSNYFIDVINNIKFKVSYNSFFQVNRNINKKLFDIINDNLNKDENVLDLYCGVGTLGINASYKSKYVIGIDNFENNIKDANENKKLNDIKNIKFIFGDASIFPKYVDDKIETIIVDPPRNGLNGLTLKNILNYKPNKIIYVSCDPFTLVRDLKELLNSYSIKKYYLLDMFPFTHHIESIVILNKEEYEFSL